jgi:checkpoint serine/threonine-protein kinase
MATPARQAHSAQHQQPPQTPVVDADVILDHKENIKPLASGRRAAALADVFTPKSKEDRSARLATDKKKHAKECDNALDNDDDPLAAFVRFVDWTVDNYPQGECVESGLLELLELATRTFADSPLYKNDMRYLKLWILYASIVDHSAKIYAYLNANEIGTGYALFYEEYCNALERCGQYVHSTRAAESRADEADELIGVEKLQRCTTLVSPDEPILSRGFKPDAAISTSA